mmetsp:Transcript_57661/g.172037  ORF Transcript_57661/g.172037 Transcript_57661/m.172037 type:complete len:184 (-) Transcript_57661:1719-2270(-)
MGRRLARPAHSCCGTQQRNQRSQLGGGRGPSLNRCCLLHQGSPGQGSLLGQVSLPGSQELFFPSAAALPTWIKRVPVEANASALLRQWAATKVRRHRNQQHQSPSDLTPKKSSASSASTERQDLDTTEGRVRVTHILSVTEEATPLSVLAPQSPAYPVKSNAPTGPFQSVHDGPLFTMPLGTS